VFRRVLVLRIVTTTDMAARAAQTQMNPAITKRQALFATVAASGASLDERQVRALHDSSSAIVMMTPN
jgi:hypothetical protein